MILTEPSIVTQVATEYKMTDKALTGAWKVLPDSRGHIFHHFGQGKQHFKLVATVSDNQESASNAFLARVSVIPPYEK